MNTGRISNEVNYVWCVDVGSSKLSGGLIHSSLFLTKEEAQAYYDRYSNPMWYRKMYKCRDIWHFTERQMEASKK